MQISNYIREKIIEEFKQFEDDLYAGRTKEERKAMGQFFTPPVITIQMLEKFSDLNGSVLDPTCGAGNLLAAAIIAGADPRQCYGVELDENILKKCQDRLSRLGVPSRNIHHGNALNPSCLMIYDDCYSFDPNDGPVGHVYINGRRVLTPDDMKEMDKKKKKKKSTN